MASSEKSLVLILYSSGSGSNTPSPPDSFTATLWKRHHQYHHPHFINNETEAKRFMGFSKRISSKANSMGNLISLFLAYFCPYAGSLMTSMTSKSLKTQHPRATFSLMATWAARGLDFCRSRYTVPKPWIAAMMQPMVQSAQSSSSQSSTPGTTGQGSGCVTNTSFIILPRVARRRQRAQ